MTMTTDITDEELTAYLDGEADTALRARIDQTLTSDPEVAARLDALSIDTSSLKAEFDGLLMTAPNNLVPAANDRSPPRAFGGAIVASMILGLTMGYTIFSPSTPAKPGWTQYVAAYQALYVSETLNTVSPSEPSELIRLSEVIGRDLNPATEIDTLNFKRGQVLGFNGKPLIQLAYLTEDGKPVALCVIRNGSPQQDIEHRELEGMQAASWSDGTFSYLLIGGADADLIAETATKFKARL